MKFIIKTFEKWQNTASNWLQNCPVYKDWQEHPEKHPGYDIFRNMIPKCTFECALQYGCKIGKT